MADWKEQLSIIYANRSACLYHLENYDLAISDIQRALDHGYPKDLRYKVYDRYVARGTNIIHI
jgi:SET and MYND domain-containing protein 4